MVPGQYLPFMHIIAQAGEYHHDQAIGAHAYARSTRYRWSIAPGYVMPYQLVPIAKPKDGLRVRLERRPG